MEVDLLPSPGTGKAEQALIDGAVDVLWAGPMRVMKHHDDHPDSPLVCFAEIVCRDPFSIVGRYPNPDFQLADLAKMRFASVSEVPTPWLCLQEDLRQAGIDPGRLDRIGDRSMTANLAALRQGDLDAAQFFEPVVEEALATGVGHLWLPASRRGRTTYTAFVTTRDRMRTRCRAAAEHGARHLPDPAMAARKFASGDCGRYRVLLSGTGQGRAGRSAGPLSDAKQVWGSDPLLPEDGFDRLRRSLVSGGFIRRAVPYRECVDNRLAQQTLAAFNNR